MRGRSAGSHQLDVGPVLEADRQGEIAGLTEVVEGVTLEGLRGDEAEDLIRDILFLSDRLIRLVALAFREER